VRLRRSTDNTIVKDLVIITTLRTLKDIAVIDETLFENVDREVLVKLVVKFSNQLIAIGVKGLLNDSVLESVEITPILAPSHQISS